VATPRVNDTGLTSSNPFPAGYMRGFATACDRACAVTAVTREVSLGRVAVRLRFAGPALLPLVERFTDVATKRTSSAAARLAVDLWDAESTGVDAPPVPMAGAVSHGRGAFAYEPTARTWISFPRGIRRDGTYDATIMLDERTGRAQYFVRNRDVLPAHEWAAPLRAVLQWGLNGPDRLLVHAGAVGMRGQAALLTGPSGSGKSTTAVAAMLAGCDCLGDDYVFLDMGRSRAMAHSVYRTAKLTADAVRLLPGLAPALTHGASHDEKRVIDLGLERSRRSLPVTAIVVPFIEPARAGRLDRISPGAALRALAPTSVLHTPQRDATELGPLGRLARAIPAYALAVGSGDPIADVTPMLTALLGAETAGA
jgi:hypothetical protein